MSMNRRSFLTNCSAGALGLGISQLLPVAPAKAQVNQPKHLVIAFLAGGLDSHFALPYLGATESLVATRRPGLAVPTSDRFTINGEIGMHNSMSVLNTGAVANILNNNTKFVTMAGIQHDEGGHAGATKVMSTLTANTTTAKDGWIGRAKEALGNVGCYGFRSPRLAHLPNGSNPCLIVSDLNSFSFDLAGFSNTEETRMVNAMQSLLAAGKQSGIQAPLRADIEDATSAMFQALPVVEEIRATNINDGLFEANGSRASITRYFQNTARLIKKLDGDGVNTITQFSQSGYDNHGGLLANLPPLLSFLSSGIYGFWSEMIGAGLEDQVTLMVVSEFGRGNGQNETGSDHGLGQTAWVMGGQVQGGPGNTVYGEIPDEVALAQHKMPVTFDIRNLHHSTLTWMGVNPASVILDPAFSPDPSFQLYQS